MADKPRNRNTAYKRDVKPYLLTGHAVVDMVGACINHAERHFRRVKEIKLHPKYWERFLDGVRRIDETYTASTKEVDWDNVIVKPASTFQPTPLEYELVPLDTTLKTVKN